MQEATTLMETRDARSGLYYVMVGGSPCVRPGPLPGFSNHTPVLREYTSCQAREYQAENTGLAKLQDVCWQY